MALPAWVRLHFDRVRDRWVLLAPERVLFPCATSVTIIERLGGGRGVGELVDALADEFEAPRETISADVRQMLQGLADQGFLAVESRAWLTITAAAAREPWTEPPMGLLAELTHRCPLQCPYCSNPLELERANGELDTAEWCRVLDEAAALGVLQVHLSGGEPTARARSRGRSSPMRAGSGLYTNLITAGVLLDERRIAGLREAGLEHVQLSLQAAEPAVADRVGGYRDGHAKKLVVARAVRAAGPAAHRQRRRAPAESRPARGDGRRWPWSSARTGSRWRMSSITAGR